MKRMLPSSQLFGTSSCVRRIISITELGSIATTETTAKQVGGEGEGVGVGVEAPVDPKTRPVRDGDVELRALVIIVNDGRQFRCRHTHTDTRAPPFTG